VKLGERGEVVLGGESRSESGRGGSVERRRSRYLRRFERGEWRPSWARSAFSSGLRFTAVVRCTIILRKGSIESGSFFRDCLSLFDRFVKERTRSEA